MSESEFALYVLYFFAFGVTGVVVVLVWAVYWVYKAKLLEREERRLMIEKGLMPPAPVPLGWAGVRARELELKAEEMRLRIGKGLDVPVDAPTVSQDSLRRGLVSLALGLGLASGYVVFKTSGFVASQTTENWFLFFGVISPGVALYGAANIVHYWMTRNSNASNDPNDSATAPDRAR